MKIRTMLEAGAVIAAVALVGPARADETPDRSPDSQKVAPSSTQKEPGLDNDRVGG